MQQPAALPIGEDMGNNFGLNAEENIDKIEKPKRARWDMKTELAENSTGISSLYQAFVLNHTIVKKEGRELSDFNRIMKEV